MNRFLFRAAPGLLAALFLFALAACDATDATPDADAPPDDAIASSELSDLTNGLVEDLSLSDAGARALRAAVAQHQRRHEQPGFLWHVADALQQRLSDAQKERLFARLDEAPGAFRDRRDFRDRRERALDGLDLSDEQHAALRAIREAYAPQFRALIEARQSGDLTEEDFREEMQALREALRAEVDEVLTPEQRAQLDEWRERREERRENLGERREESRAAMVEVLGLTEDQQSALRALRETQHEERQALFAAVRDGEMDREALPEALRALRESGETALAEIVTMAQLETMKIHRLLVRYAAARMAKGKRGPRA